KEAPGKPLKIIDFAIYRETRRGHCREALCLAWGPAGPYLLPASKPLLEPRPGTLASIVAKPLSGLPSPTTVTSSKPDGLNSLYLPGRPADTRVVVAMSGGVDSSVVAALLKSQHYDVIGITLQLYDHGQAQGRKGACCAGQDIQDARRVAEGLGIPH